MPPEVAAQAARKRAEGIEAALGVLAAVGTIDGAEVQMLKECPTKAKHSAQERPLAQQINHTESHLERAKRLTADDAARQQLVTDVEESEVRLERLCALPAAAGSVPRPRVSPESGNQVQCLQQKVNQLQEERDALAGRHCGTPQGQTEIVCCPWRRYNPPMPILVPGDLSDWMQDRQADLQDAMNGGNCVKVLDLT